MKSSHFELFRYLPDSRRLYPLSFHLVFQIYWRFAIFISNRFSLCSLSPILRFSVDPINIKLLLNSFLLEFCPFILLILSKYFIDRNRNNFTERSLTHFYKQISLQSVNQIFHFFWHMSPDASPQSSFQHLRKDYINLYLSLEFQRKMITLNQNLTINRTTIFNNLNNNDQFRRNQKLYWTLCDLQKIFHLSQIFLD